MSRWASVPLQEILGRSLVPPGLWGSLPLSAWAGIRSWSERSSSVTGYFAKTPQPPVLNRVPSALLPLTFLVPVCHWGIKERPHREGTVRGRTPVPILGTSCTAQVLDSGKGGLRRAGQARTSFSALITSEKRPSGRAKFGGSAFRRDRFDYKSSALMPGSQGLSFCMPRDKYKLCRTHQSPVGPCPHRLCLRQWQARGRL